MKENNREFILPLCNEPFEYSSDKERKFAEEMEVLDDMNIQNVVDGEEVEEYIKRHS